MTTLAIALRTFAPRRIGMTTIPAVFFLLLLLSIPSVAGMGVEVYESMPEAMLLMAGVPRGASVEVMAYSQILGFMGALTLAGFAVAIGAQIIAGEEQDRTLTTVLSAPVSRIATATAKASGMVAALAVATAGLWVASWAAAWVFQVELGQTHLGELCLAMGVHALLSGALAFALGAATGSRGLALGAGSGVLALGWLLSSLLPMWADGSDAARFVPYHWYAGPQVLLNGLDGGYLALILGATVLLVLVGIAGFARRDLRTGSLSWRRNRTATAPGRLDSPEPSQRSTTLGKPRGKATHRAGSLTWLLWSRHRALLLILGLVMFGFMGLMMGPLFADMAPDLVAMTERMPAELMRLWGAGDMSTPAGFYWGETMGLMAPAAVILAGTAVASRLAGDEGTGYLGLLLATGATRSRVLGTAIGVQLGAVVLIAVATGLGIWGGVALGDLSLPAAHIWGATAHLLALGVFMAATATLATALAGRSAVTTWVAVGVAVVGYAVNSILPMNPDLADWARLSPFYYYASSQPLEQGANWGHVAILLVGAAILIAVSFPALQRRDLIKG